MTDRESRSTIDAAVAGASTALLAVLRARRPDLTWEISQIDDQDELEHRSSGRSVLDLLKETRPTASDRYSLQYHSQYHSPDREIAPVDNAEKVRENRSRRAAKRRGLDLVKSRTRDPKALEYGRWWIVDLETREVIYGADQRRTLEDVEAWLEAN